MDFWAEVTKFECGKRASPVCVWLNTADNFADKYEELYNSVSYNVTKLENISTIIEDRAQALDGYAEEYAVSADEVADGVMVRVNC